MEMDIRRIQWQETIEIRHKVLWPNESPEFCHIAGDENAWHFGAFVQNGLVTVASVYPEGEIARLRKFATATAHPGKGLGTEMLQHILSESVNSGSNHFWRGYCCLCVLPAQMGSGFIYQSPVSAVLGI